MKTKIQDARIQDTIRDAPRDRSIRDIPRDTPRINDAPRDSIRRDTPQRIDRQRTIDSVRRNRNRVYRPQEPKRGTAVDLSRGNDWWQPEKTPIRPRGKIILPVPPQRRLRDTGINFGQGRIQTSRKNVVSPLDCIQYPDSPFCGGNPFGLTPVGFGVDGIVIDKCTIGIQYGGTIGFVKTPKWQIVIRSNSPECNPSPNGGELEPVPPPGGGKITNPPAFNPGDYYLIFFDLKRESKNGISSITYPSDYVTGYSTGGNSTSITSGNASLEMSVEKRFIEQSLTCELELSEVNKYEWSGTVRGITNVYIDDDMTPPLPKQETININDSGREPPITTTGKILSGNNADFYRVTIPDELEVWQVLPSFWTTLETGEEMWVSPSSFPSNCYYGRGEDLDTWLQWRIQGKYEVRTDVVPPSSFPGITGGGYKVTYSESIKIDINIKLCLEARGPNKATLGSRFYNSTLNERLTFSCVDYEPDILKIPPPIDPYNRKFRPTNRPKKDDCDMCCCNDKNGDNAELLRQIKLLRREIGFGDVNLPDSLRSHFGREPKQQKIESLTHMMAQQIQYFDEIMGRWEVPIHVKDSDPTEAGDQGMKITIPNLSTAIGLLCQFVIDNNNAGKVSKIASSSALAEIAQCKQMLAKQHYMIEALVEYFGFKTEETKELLPILCTIFQKEKDGSVRAIGRPSEFLQNSHVEINKLSYKPSQKEENYQDTLFDLAQAAAIIRAVFWKRVDSDDPAESIKQNVLDHDSNIERLIDSEKSDMDFQQQLDFIENAFGHLPQRTNPEVPWNLPYENRPKIKDVSPGNQQGADSDGSGRI